MYPKPYSKGDYRDDLGNKGIESLLAESGSMLIVGTPLLLACLFASDPSRCHCFEIIQIPSPEKTFGLKA